MTRAQADAILERTKNEEPLELEKNDLLAIIMAAFAVFVPFILILAGIMIGAWWFITMVWGA